MAFSKEKQQELKPSWQKTAEQIGKGLKKAEKAAKKIMQEKSPNQAKKNNKSKGRG